MTDQPVEEPVKGDRIAKVIARAGICSRRDAERLIADGKVAVNGIVLETPATLVTADDEITIDGAPVRRAVLTRLWRYHKPAGLITSHRDPQGRPTVFDNLPKNMPRVISVGRLDLNSEGLLLLTNDGALARRLEHPENSWERRYRVRVYGRPDPTELANLAKGVSVDGVDYGPIDASLSKAPASTKADGRMKDSERRGANSWLSVTLREGKNREIRKVMAHIGLRTNRLIRTDYGPFTLGSVEPGAVAEIPADELFEKLAIGAKPKPRPKQNSRHAHRRR